MGVAGQSSATITESSSSQADNAASPTAQTESLQRLASDQPSEVMFFSAPSGHKDFGTADVGYDDGTHVVTIHLYATVDATAQTCSLFGQGIPAG